MFVCADFFVENQNYVSIFCHFYTIVHVVEFVFSIISDTKIAYVIEKVPYWRWYLVQIMVADHLCPFLLTWCNFHPSIYK